MSELPPTLLAPEPQSVLDDLDAAVTADASDGYARLRRIVAANPRFLAGWAQLSEWALAEDAPVEAYAFARTGYHRGLDRIRSEGWRGAGPVPWSHEPNRGFLRAVQALMEAAATIGELPEAQRCRDFLLDLDPEDSLGVRRRSFGALPMA